MPAKRFALIASVILAVVIGTIALIALPNSRDAESVPTFPARAYIASMKVDLVRLASAEEDYYRDSLRYTTVLACTTPATPGTARFCPSPDNMIEGMSIAGPGWSAVISNDHLAGVRCVIYVNLAPLPPATRDGTPECARFPVSFVNPRPWKIQAAVASLQADLGRLVGAEEAYFRDSFKYTNTVLCTTPPARGAVTFCPARGNMLAGLELVGPGWRATMINVTLPDVRCSVFMKTGPWYPALVEGTPLCRRPGWSGRANDTTGEIK
jgi:hypothetical protein